MLQIFEKKIRDRHSFRPLMGLIANLSVQSHESVIPRAAQRSQWICSCAHISGRKRLRPRWPSTRSRCYRWVFLSWSWCVCFCGPGASRAEQGVCGRARRPLPEHLTLTSLHAGIVVATQIHLHPSTFTLPPSPFHIHHLSGEGQIPQENRAGTVADSRTAGFATQEKVKIECAPEVPPLSRA
jgi:hypothetical protein